MANELTLQTVEKKIITLRNEKIILDSDVAELYGVETKRINEAVTNNPDKFPQGYIVSLDSEEWNLLKSKLLTSSGNEFLRSKISTLKIGRGEHTKYPPKAFTEKGLYMLATILKSKQATATTLAIVEAFAKLRELSRAVAELAETKDKNTQKSLMEQSGEIMSELLYGGLEETDTETSLEINLALMKFKHTVKRKKK
jgi:phage regulator Rha-like protein